MGAGTRTTFPPRGLCHRIFGAVCFHSFRLVVGSRRNNMVFDYPVKLMLFAAAHRLEAVRDEIDDVVRSW